MRSTNRSLRVMSGLRSEFENRKRFRLSKDKLDESVHPTRPFPPMDRRPARPDPPPRPTPDTTRDSNPQPAPSPRKTENL
jgi:hypothetical protein